MNFNKQSLNVVKEMGKRLIREEDGMGTVEISLIVVLLIGLVVTFKSAIVGFVLEITGKFSSRAGRI